MVVKSLHVLSELINSLKTEIIDDIIDNNHELTTIVSFLNFS